MQEITKVKKPDKQILQEIAGCLGANFQRERRNFSKQRLFLKKKLLSRYLLNPNVSLYIVRKGNSILGFAFRNFLEWDSDIFGFKICRIENLSCGMAPAFAKTLLKTMINHSRAEGYSHINCRIGLRDFGALRLLEESGFRVADVQLTLKTPQGFDAVAPSAEKFIIRKAVEEDLGRLEKNISGIFTDTRFVRDPKYPRQKVDRLYLEWASNSILDAGQTVFIIQQKKSREFIGFCICKIDPDAAQALGMRIGFIDLIAITEKYRGQGIGRLFAGFVLDWFKARVDLVEIRTQISNSAAIRAFMAAGFSEFSSGVVLPPGISLHLWF